MTGKLRQELQTNGWAMKPPGFLPFDLGAASSEFERMYAEKAAESGYENVAQLFPQDMAVLPVADALLQQVKKHMQAISPSLKFGQLWLVKSREENVHADVVPFVPHIDNGRYIKAMVYLDDVSADDGPFTVASVPPDSFDAMRKRFGADYKARSENVISCIPREAFHACTGPAGSVIFFDTNCPHFAGHVRRQGQRRIFRFNFTNPAWNQPSFGARVARKIRRLVGG
jgi:ectoine hydroxylase-related dioxygenase (phytanoyl-CoA dioxygenase family)